MKDDIQSAFTLSGQVALVTASANGIGKACALALAQAGADVILGLSSTSPQGRRWSRYIA